MRREEKICKMMDFSFLVFSQHSDLDVDNDVLSVDSQMNSMDDDDNDDDN